MENKVGWKAKSENKYIASLDDAKFIYDQAEKKLKEVNLASDLVVTRVTTLISVITALLIALIGFTINRYLKTSSFDKFTVSSIIEIIYLIPVLWYVSLNIKGYNYAVIGASPKTLFSDSFFSQKQRLEESVRSKMFIWTQIENYQDSIERNTITNNLRWYRFNKSIKLLMLVPIVLIISIITLFLLF